MRRVTNLQTDVPYVDAPRQFHRSQIRILRFLDGLVETCELWTCPGPFILLVWHYFGGALLAQPSARSLLCLGCVGSMITIRSYTFSTPSIELTWIVRTFYNKSTIILPHRESSPLPSSLWRGVHGRRLPPCRPRRMSSQAAYKRRISALRRQGHPQFQPNSEKTSFR